MIHFTHLWESLGCVFVAGLLLYQHAIIVSLRKTNKRLSDIIESLPHENPPKKV